MHCLCSSLHWIHISSKIQPTALAQPAKTVNDRNNWRSSYHKGLVEYILFEILNISLLGNSCTCQPKLCVCYSGQEVMRNRKGSKIRTTDRIPLSHGLISIPGGMGMTQVLPNQFSSFWTSNSKTHFKIARDCQRRTTNLWRPWGFIIVLSVAGNLYRIASGAKRLKNTAILFSGSCTT